MRKNENFNIICQDTFLIRLPILTINVYNDILQKYNEEKLCELYNSELREHIMTSSIQLYNSLDKKKTEETLFSLYKYLNRAATRTTPFGMLSFVMRGRFSEEINTNFAQNLKKFAMPDMAWIYSIIMEAEKQLGGNLRVITNKAIKQNSMHCINEWNVLNKKFEKYTQINNTKAVQKIFEICESYISINEICCKLKKQYDNVPNKVIYNTIIDLLANGFLISDIRLNTIHGDVFKTLVKMIDNYDISIPIYSDLSKLLNLLDEYNNIPFGEGQDKYLDICKKMNDLNNVEKPIQIDSYSDDVLQLPNTIKEELLDYVDFLLRFSTGNNSRFKKFKIAFIEKYGHQAIKLTDVIDEYRGIGYQDIFNEDKINKSLRIKLTEFIIDQLTGRKTDIVDLEKFNLDIDISKEKILDNFELSFEIYENEKQLKYISTPLVGSNGTESSLGRFEYLFEEDLIYKKSSDGLIYVEISSIPNNLRAANIMKGKIKKDKYLLEIGTYTQDDSICKIDVNDIYVKIDDRIRFYSKKLNKELIFISMNKALNDFYPKLIQFLIIVSQESHLDLFSLFRHLFEITNGCNKRPRFIYKNFTVLPKMWKLDNNYFYEKEVLCSKEKFRKLFIQYKSKNDIDDIVLVNFQDQSLQLNVSYRENIDILYKLYKQNNNIKLLEAERILYKPLVNHNNNYYYGEFIFQLKNDTVYRSYNKELDYSNYESIRKHAEYPLVNWLCVKLYVNDREEDFILSNYLFRFVKEMQKRKIIKNFFFIRYKDERTFLRLRFNFTKLDPMINELNKLFLCLLTQNLIESWHIEPYYQEYNRYGGEYYFENSEKLFVINSLTILDLIYLKYNKLISMKKTELFMICAVFILEMLGYNLLEVNSMLLHKRDKKVLDSKFRNRKKYLMEILDNSNNWRNLKRYNEGIKVYSVLEREKAGVDIEELRLSHFSVDKERTIALSLLHMTFNRLVGINRELENITLSQLENIIYAINKEREFKNA